MTALPFDQPTEVEFLNPKPGYLRAKDGTNNYFIRFAITREVWALFESAPAFERLKGWLWSAADDESDSEPIHKAIEKAVKAPKGPYGKFWEQMYKRGAIENLEIAGALDVETIEEIKPVLYDLFSVESLAQVDPLDFLKWAKETGIHPLVIIVEQILRAMGSEK